MRKNAAQHWTDGARAQQPEIDTLRSTLEEAVGLLRRTTEALDYQVNENHPQVLEARAFLSRLDAGKAGTR